MEGKVRAGFTLIEMTVVLLVIALATHLAMRSLGRVGEQKLVQAANRQLEEIRASVFAYDDADAPMGFLADMGRLIVVTNTAHGTLAELWEMPKGAKPYGVRPAVKANFVPLPEATLKALTNANILVATGWRGPYLRLPLGKSRLMDPWGNPFENPDTAGYRRITVTNNLVATGLTHFGPTALANDAHRQTISLIPEGGGTSRLIVSVVSTSGERKDAITYKWYGPHDGLITGGVTNMPYGAPAIFTGLTPGMRTLWDSASRVARQIKMRPGDNYEEIRVP